MDGFEKQRIANLISGISHCTGGDTSLFLKTVTRQVFENNKMDFQRLYDCLSDVYNSLIAVGFTHPPQEYNKDLKTEPRGKLTHWWASHGDCKQCEANWNATERLKNNYR